MFNSLLTPLCLSSFTASSSCLYPSKNSMMHYIYISTTNTSRLVNPPFLSPNSILLEKITHLNGRGPLQIYVRRYISSSSTEKREREATIVLSHVRTKTLTLEKQGDNNTHTSHRVRHSYLLYMEKKKHTLVLNWVLRLSQWMPSSFWDLKLFAVVILDDRICDDYLSYRRFN